MCLSASTYETIDKRIDSRYDKFHTHPSLYIDTFAPTRIPPRYIHVILCYWGSLVSSSLFCPTPLWVLHDDGSSLLKAAHVMGGQDFPNLVPRAKLRDSLSFDLRSIFHTPFMDPCVLQEHILTSAQKKSCLPTARLKRRGYIDPKTTTPMIQHTGPLDVRHTQQT